MANSNEAPTKSAPQTSEATSKQDKDISKNPTPAKQSYVSRLFAPALTTTIAVVALVSALYALALNKNSEQQVNKQSKILEFSVNELQQRQRETQADFSAIKEKIDQFQKDFQSRVQALNKNLQVALQQRLYEKEDLLLLKSRYFLELAQINAHWSDDPQVTIALLQQADDLLPNITSQNLFTVRQAIAKEISQLEALPKIDIPGLLSQLDAAQNAISNLPIKQPLNSSTANQPAESESTSPWKAKLKSSMNVLEKLVVIRHNDEDIRPLVSPLHQTLLRDSIRLNLQEAQWAILQNNPKVYQLSLDRAIQDIKRAFDENSPATQSLLKELQTLQQEKFVKQRISIDESLQLLNQVIESTNTPIQDKVTTPKGGKKP